MNIRLVLMDGMTTNWDILVDGEKIGFVSKMTKGYNVLLHGFPQIGEFGWKPEGLKNGAFHVQYKKQIIPNLEYLIEHGELPE